MGKSGNIDLLERNART